MTDHSISNCDADYDNSVPREHHIRHGSEEKVLPKYFFLKPKLLTALSSVGAVHTPYTFKEVLSLLKAYIFEKRALDPQDSRFVICADTDLGQAFEVERFEYSQVRNLISRNLICVPYTADSMDSSNTADGKIGQNINSPSTSQSSSSHLQKSWQIYIPEVPDHQSAPESEYSYQGYDTAVCQDSDCAINEESDQEEIEYELVTESEADIKDHNDSESDVENIILFFGLEESENSDEECFADGSHSSSGSESEENSTDEERDQWFCVTCGIKNKPFMRYCLKCWELRKDWYPEPPKRRRKRKARPKKDKKKITLEKKNLQEFTDNSVRDTASDSHFAELERTSSTASSSTTTSSSSSSSSVFTASSQDSGIGSQDLSSFEVFSLRKRKNSETEDGKKKAKKNFEIEDVSISKICKKFKKFSDSAEGKHWLKSSKGKELLEMIQGLSSDSDTEESSPQGNCTLCYSRPKNGSIIHGRLSHIGFCYPCVKKLYNSKSKCPICRRKIHMITKNSYV